MKHPLDIFGYCPRCGKGGFAINDFKSKRCSGCGFTLYFNAIAAAVAVIVNEKGELLVSRRAKEPAKGTLDLPGGFCDSYETAEEGVKRELEEETGLKIKDIRYLFSIPNIYCYSGMELHTMDLFFHCIADDTDTLVADDDVAELQWIAIDKLQSKDFGLASIRKGIEMLKEKNNTL